MKIKDILAIVAVALMTGGCSSSDEVQSGEGRVPITLTASVGTEVATRGVQETELTSDETVYVWGKEGAGDYDYLQAWALTAGTGGTLTGSAKYYPLSGETLTMVALHGNFSYTEGDALPATISHSVEADQSDANAYEKSDLLWATETGSSTNATSKSLVFTHKLSKIEVKLHPGEGYSVSDIASAEVRMRGVLPTITIDPTDGSLGSASGTTILVKARMTENHLEENTPYALYEAIIPPQAAPTAFLNIKIGEKIATVAADVATFASNKRYLYDITIKEFEVNVTSSIASWGTDITKNKIVEIGRPKLPIEYIAETNVTASASDINASNIYTATTHRMATANTQAASAYFSWNSATTVFTHAWVTDKDGNAAYYHIPSVYEWMSIIPPYYRPNISTAYAFDYDGTVDGLRITMRNGLHENLGETVGWGATWNGSAYVLDVMGKFYNDYNCPDDDEHAYIGYGLRFKDKISEGVFANGRYTCAYRYEHQHGNSDADVENGGEALIIKVKYVGFNQAITIQDISKESWWTAVDFTVVLPVTGYKDSSNHNNNQNKDYPAPQSLSSLTHPDSGYSGFYWAAENVVINGYDKYAYRINFVDYNLNGLVYGLKTYSYPVRLFKDSE